MAADRSDAPAPGEITRLLRAAAAGDRAADAALLPVVYGELRRVAARIMSGEGPSHTLTPTALLHEAWLRFDDGLIDAAHDRRHFFALAARRMRQVLVDHAREREAAKRGGGRERITLTRIDAATPPLEIDLVALDQALAELEAADARKARVVELRYFAGFEMVEIAEILGISRATAQRDWEVARAFLFRALG
jgi:RNA polymerase sigma factor (TIGR02999 family)